MRKWTNEVWYCGILFLSYSNDQFAAAADFHLAISRPTADGQTFSEDRDSL